jgi:peptidoglycan/LPS O-acetylase OafA/YrhL
MSVPLNPADLPAAASTPKRHLYGLDLLRIAAAALVLLNHFALFGWAAPDGFASGSAAAFPWIAPFAGTGAVGVQIFFVISGFVITMSTIGVGPADFVRHRVIRIVPALWICAVIAFGARLAYGEPAFELVPALLRSITLSPIGPHIDGVVWTLVVEAVFYGLVFLMMLRAGGRGVNVLAVVLALMSAVFLSLFAAAMVFELMAGQGRLDALMDRFPFKVLLLRHGVFFAAGMLLFSIHHSGQARWKTGMLMLCGCFGLVEIAISTKSWPMGLASGLIWLAGLCAIIISFCSAESIERKFAKRSKLIRDLGRLSYPLYLNHYSLGMVLVPSLFAAGISAVLAFVISMTTILGSSWAVMRWPEAWAQSWMRRLLFVAPKTARTTREATA